jgi:hypothetical protein
MLIGSGLQALTTLGKFKPMVLGEIQAAGDMRRRLFAGQSVLSGFQRYRGKQLAHTT